MATSLVHLFPPKHHSRALGILESVLAQNPDHVPCLLARGYVFRYAGKYSEARGLFVRVAKLASKQEEDLLILLEAQEEIGWCDALSGELTRAEGELKTVIEVLDGLPGEEEMKAKAWWRLGRTLWDQGGRSTLATRLWAISLN